MQEFPLSEDYFWMDILKRCKVTLLPFTQSKLTLHWTKSSTCTDLQCRIGQSFYSPNEIPEYSKVLWGVHQSTCTCTTIQIICRTALIHLLSETKHVHIWDGYFFAELSWNRVQSSKRWDVHVQQGHSIGPGSMRRQYWKANKLTTKDTSQD